MSDQHWECTNLVDTIVNQNDRGIKLFNPTQVAISGASPFNYRNELVGHANPSGIYPNLVENYKYRKAHVFNSRANPTTELSPDLYIGTARCTTEVKPI